LGEGSPKEGKTEARERGDSSKTDVSGKEASKEGGHYIEADNRKEESRTR
jgi:hypothetical protein